MRTILALVSFFACSGALADPALAVPLRCAMGKTCVVQNYVDEDGGPGAKDYRCGFLTYDGHKGTDIRVADVAAFERGVPVLAAAPGRVRAIRDGMADVSVKEGGRQAVARREAGNSVVVEHGDGWETQYGHMRKGSIAVRPGERVAAGQRLGLVGLSGDTEFPHLHFEVRRRRAIVDPFVGMAGGAPCAAGRAPLWTSDAMEQLAYVPTGVLAASLAGEVPVLGADGVVRAQSLKKDSAAAVFWVQIFGAQAGDEATLRLVAPDGSVLAERRVRVAKNLAQAYSYVGLRRRGAEWPEGSYRGEYRLRRGGAEVLSLGREATLRW